MIDKELIEVYSKSPDNIMVTIHDRDFNIIKANKKAKEVLDLPFFLAGKDVKCFRYFHRKDSPHEKCPTCRCLMTGKPKTIQIFEPHLQGVLKIRVIPQFDRNHNFKGVIHFAWYVT